MPHTHVNTQNYQSKVQAVSHYLLESSKHALQRDKEILLGASAYTTGCAAALTQFLSLSGVFGESFYNLAFSTKVKLAALLKTFFYHEPLARKMINFYESAAELQIYSYDLMEGILIEKMSNAYSLIRSAASKTEEIASGIKDLVEHPNRFFELIKHETQAGEAFLSEKPPRVQSEKALLQTLKKLSLSLLSANALGLYSSAVSGFGNACMALNTRGFLELDQLVMAVMTGTLDSPRYHPVDPPVDYAFEATTRITEFAQIEDINTITIARVIHD